MIQRYPLGIESIAVGRAIDLSVVVPFYNEELNVGPMYESLRAALDLLERPSEIIFVDDGSRDRTLEQMRAIQVIDPSVRIVSFRRNFGQTAAMRAGIQRARGRVIVTMDGDLQNDPRDMPLLLEKIESGYDMAIGWRQDRQDPYFSRILPSRLANWMISSITGVWVHDNGCSLKAYRGELIKRLPLYSEMHRFIPALSTLAGARIAEVVVRHHPRRQGQSKYGLSRIGKVLLDVLTVKMLIAFSRRPMHWFFLLTVPFFLFAMLAASLHVITVAVGRPEAASFVLPTAAILLLFLTGHFVFAGLLAELIVRTAKYRELWRRR